MIWHVFTNEINMQFVIFFVPDLISRLLLLLLSFYYYFYCYYIFLICNFIFFIPANGDNLQRAHVKGGGGLKAVLL